MDRRRARRPRADGRHGTVDIVITTLDKPDFCAKLLTQIGEDELLRPYLDTVFVSEQGKKKVADHELFPLAEKALGDLLVVSNTLWGALRPFLLTRPRGLRNLKSAGVFSLPRMLRTRAPAAPTPGEGAAGSSARPVERGALAQDPPVGNGDGSRSRHERSYRQSGSGAHPCRLFRTRSRRGARPAVSVRRHRFGSWLVLEVEGEMDMQAAALVADVDGRESAFVVFDLHGVTFMDATGLRVMATMRRRAVAAGGCVRVVAPSGQARRLLMLSRSDRLFRVFGSVLEAVSTPVGPRDTGHDANWSAGDR